MPKLTTRSKSARLENESSTFFTQKKGFQIVSTAAVQLMLSPSDNTEKWFKSSTGILCFLRDTGTHSQSFTYYLRLYSFMQGNLWEQKLVFPFEYVKQNDFFHYIKLEKFSFGFKFVCEDEAERFYTIISKFCSLQSLTAKSPALEQKPRASRRSSFTFRTRLSSLGHEATIKETDRAFLEGTGLKKRSVSKRDISCPFRCSCIDLNQGDSPSPSPPIVSKTLNKKRTYSTTTNLAPNHSITATTAFSASLVPSSPPTNSASTPVRASSCANNSANSATRKPPTPVSTVSQSTAKLRKDEWTLPDLIRNTLKELKFPPNQNYIEIVSDYISQFDSIQRFEKAIQLESEKSKLTAFLYVSDALRTIDKSKQAKGHETPSDKSNLAKSVLNSTPLTASFPIAHPESSSIRMIDQEPVYTTVNVVKTRIHQYNLQQQQQGTPSTQRVPSSPASTITYSTRTQTPSPSRSSVVYKRIVDYNSNNSSGHSDAPPKPPRRTSLKFVN